MAYRLALALILMSLALAEMLRTRWSSPGFVAYIGVLVLGFLTHLTAPAFIGAALGVSGLVRLWFRTTTVRREIYLLMPLALLLTWYFAATSGSHAHAAQVYDWAGSGSGSPWVRKIRNLQSEFIAFDRRLATTKMILFAACILWPVRRELKRLELLRKPLVVEQLLLAAAFLGIYFVLPVEGMYAYYVDIRALPMITLFLLLACVWLPTEQSAGQTFGNARVLGLAALLAIANLAYLTVLLEGNNSWIYRYRAIVASVPKGAYVLPIHTETRQQYVLHVGSHVVLDRDAISPYLFSGPEDPETYFLYKSPRYAPGIQWYRRQLHGAEQAIDSAVDWNRIACNYDFLLVTMPFDPAFIHVPTAKVASNDSATLLAVDKGACRAGAPSG